MRKNNKKIFLILGFVLIGVIIWGLVGRKVLVKDNNLMDNYYAVMSTSDDDGGGGGSTQITCNVTGCQRCSSNNYCSVCQSGYSFSNGRCVKYEVKNTITFNSNGGSGTMNNQVVSNNVSTKLNSNTFTRTGYIFKEWNTKADGSGTIYINGGNIKITSDITLYAIWNANTYTITANANGGIILENSGWNFVSDGKTVTKSVVYDTTYGKLPVPLRSGYTFNGWYTAQTGGKEVISTTKVHTVVNYTMYARWTKNTGTETTSRIAFNANDGTDSKVFQIINNNTSTALKENTYKKTGYTFLGWNTKIDGSGTNYSNKANITVNSDLVLFAKWNANKYTITADANGGTISSLNGWSSKTSSTATNTVTYGTTYGNLPIPIKSGYKFLGWYTAKTGGKEVTSTTKVYTTVNYTMYARWQEAVSVMITYNANGGTGEMNKQKVSSDSLTPLNENLFKKSGYTFAGWNTKADGKGATYQNKGNIRISANITLYAMWKANTYTITADANGGTISSLNGWTKISNIAATKNVTHGTPYGNLPVPTRAGYRFVGWYTAKTDGKEVVSTTIAYTVVNYTMYARWVEDKVIIKFNSNGGTGYMNNQKVNRNVATVLNINGYDRTGYTFKGWNTKIDGTGATYQNKGNIKLSTDITLYAMWKANTYTITADANGGTISALNDWTKTSNATATKTVTYSKVYGDLPIPAREGYKFVGWYISKTSSKEVLPTSKAYTLTNYTMYARWVERTAQNIVSLTFHPNKGSGSMGVQDDILKNYTVSINENKYTRTGYTFNGWNTRADLKGTHYTDKGNIKLSADLVLYAEWKRITYTVTFDTNGGTGSMTNQVIGSNELAKLNANTLTRTGYTFAGWNTQKDGSGTAYKDKQEVKLTSNLTLYAQWVEKKKYTITFDINGGDSSSKPNSVDVYYGDELPTLNKMPVRKGHTFVGWHDKKVAFVSKKYYDENNKPLIKYDKASNLTLYAVWKKRIASYKGKDEETKTLEYDISEYANVHGGTYLITKIWVKDPYNQMKVATASKYPSTEKHYTIINNEVIKKGYQDKALVAVNASPMISNEFYSNSPYDWYGQPAINTFVHEGQIIRQYKEEPQYKIMDSYFSEGIYIAARFTAGIGKDGHLKSFLSKVSWTNKTRMIENNKQTYNIFIENEATVNDWITKNGIKNTFGWFPVLLQDGTRKKAPEGSGEKKGKAETYWNKKGNRQAVCQIDENNFVFITDTVENYGPGEKYGSTFNSLADLMVALSCKTGYNLDGGGSRTFAFKKGTTGNYKLYNSSNIYGFNGYIWEKHESYRIYQADPDTTNINYLDGISKYDRRGADMLYFVEK